MIVTIKPAKATKKEYAEQPFTLNALMGSQFTIEEKLGMSEVPRVKTVPTRDGKKTYDVVALKVSDGIFEKDLHIFETEWKSLCAALPESLVSLQGATLKATRDPNNPTRIRFEYVGTARQDMDGSSYQNGNHPSEPEAPTVIGKQINDLHQGIHMNSKLGTKTDEEFVRRMADLIRPGDAQGLIDAAKREGYITESKGIYRAE